MKKYQSVKIIVNTHKKYWMPHSKMYIPMQVGAALDKDKDGNPKDLGYQKDNDGDNISEKNPLYCELTGLYWAWKNLDADYIGLCHYRRYFGGFRSSRNPKGRILLRRELQPMLGKYRVFLPTKRHYVIESLYSHYQHTHYIEHLYVTRGIISQMYPEYIETYDKVLRQTSGHMFNIMIMDRELLNEYCTWLFNILEELEKKIDVRHMSHFQGRYCGRVSEIIFNVWLDYQIETGRIDRSEVKILPYVYMEKIDWVKKISKFLRAKIFHEKYEV
jgi:hypothetical protein